MGLPVAAFIDVAAEKARLAKALTGLSDDAQRVRKKLDNPDFMARAPETVVAEDRARLDEAETAAAKLCLGPGQAGNRGLKTRKPFPRRGGKGFASRTRLGSGGRVTSRDSSRDASAVATAAVVVARGRVVDRRRDIDGRRGDIDGGRLDSSRRRGRHIGRAGRSRDRCSCHSRCNRRARSSKLPRPMAEPISAPATPPQQRSFRCGGPGPRLRARHRAGRAADQGARAGIAAAVGLGRGGGGGSGGQGGDGCADRGDAEQALGDASWSWLWSLPSNSSRSGRA